MQSLRQWIGTPAGWHRSRYSDLPEFRDDDDLAVRHWAIVTGGLALILSRATDAELSTHFACSHELYELLRRQLRQTHFVEAPAELLSGVQREVATVADPMTKSSLRACWQARMRQAHPPGAADPMGTASHPEPGEPGPSTQVNADLLLERSTSLRKTVAAARTTATAEPHVDRIHASGRSNAADELSH